uniref:Uncharacterized protein n=1 Tax=Bradyrhizobium amphicarpaeae TaxID=1404768 RepID=A0A2U8PP67_9BRAD|nr:hypothetical protein CIT40_03960 [Bradyrhizobium amphicarpaeae]
MRVSAGDGALVRPRCRLNAILMRITLFSAFAVFTVAIFLYEAHAGAPLRAAEHCGFWTTIDAGLSCR